MARDRLRSQPGAVAELQRGVDRTLEASSEELDAATLVRYSAELAELEAADVFAVTVPTPVDGAKRPDLTSLEKASAMIGGALRARAAAGATSEPPTPEAAGAGGDAAVSVPPSRVCASSGAWRSALPM